MKFAREQNDDKYSNWNLTELFDVRRNLSGVTQIIPAEKLAAHNCDS
jgi:hypothetical protein